MTQNESAMLAADAMYDRYAPDPDVPKNLRGLLPSYRRADADTVSLDGRHSIQSERQAEYLHRVARMLDDIYARRREKSPHLAAAIEENLGLRWSRYMELLDSPGYIPSIDSEGQLAALECAESIRLEGGLIGGDAAAISAETDMKDFANANQHELEAIRRKIHMAATRTCGTNDITQDMHTIATLHANDAMKTYGITAEWVEEKNRQITDPEAMRTLSESVAGEIATATIYNIVVRAHKSLRALDGGSENAAALWLDMLNHAHHSAPVFDAESPADIIRSVREIMDVSDAAWRRFLKMPRTSLRKILTAMRGSGKLSSPSIHSQSVLTLKRKYRPLILAVERRATLGESRHKSANELLDSLFATNVEARHHERRWENFTNLIRSYIAAADLTPAQRGCPLPCVHSTMRALVKRHSAGARHMRVPPMTWRQYVISMDAADAREPGYAPPEGEEEKILHSPLPTHTDGDLTLTPITSEEQAAGLLYSVRYETTRHIRSGYLPFLVSEGERDRAVIIMRDVHGYGQWKASSLRFTDAQTQNSLPLEDAVERLTQRLRRASRRERRAERTAA